MANSAPPWIQSVSVSVTVNNVPVSPTVLSEVPIGIVNRYSGASTSYQIIAQWSVTAGKTGKLIEVSMMTNNYAKTLWQLVVGNYIIMTNEYIQTPLTLPFDDLLMLQGWAVTLQCKSSDGTAIIADGSISGKELG